MNTAIPMWDPVTLPVEGEASRFPVRRVFCLGRNYADHVREMGRDPDREEPFFFIKPADAVVESGSTVPYPPRTRNLHHEVELVVAIKEGGAAIEVGKALEHVFGYAVGIDLTRRDLQAVCKERAWPWEAGKTFPGAAPCSAVEPVEKSGHPEQGNIQLQVNGETRQDGDLAAMVWKVPEIIAKCSTLFPLLPGDLIMTGTPAGVAAVSPGDSLEGSIAGVGALTVRIGDRA